MPRVQEIIGKYGLNEGGQTMCFLMQTCVARIQKYMWYQSGAAIHKMIANSPISSNKIVMPGPESQMLYHGKAMVDSETGKGPANIPNVGYRFRKGSILKATDRDLNFNKEKNPLAGPYPDRRMMAAEKDVIAREVESYIRYTGGNND